MEAEKKKTIVSAMILVASLVLLTCAAGVQALPVISNLTISPSNPWIGWDVGISAECSEDAGNSITNAIANITGPGISFSYLDLALLQGNTYGITLSGNDLAQTGSYSVSVGCINDIGEEVSASGTFDISWLTGDITSVSVMGSQDEGVIYAGEGFDAYYLIKKDGSPVKSGITFTARLNNEDKNIHQPIPFVDGKGQRLRMTAPSTEGNYRLELRANYQGEEVFNERIVEVRAPLRFEIMNVDKTAIHQVQEIKITLSASEWGIPISIKESDLDIEVNFIDAEINSIEQEGNDYAVKIMPPNLEPGSYELVIKFNHNGKTYTRKNGFSYTIPLSGEISYNGKGIVILLEFTDEDGKQVSYTTDSKGVYSGAIAPGTYDIRLERSESKLILYDVDIDEFDDPIKYYYVDDTTSIDGIDVAGLFVYETVLAFSEADIEMTYNEKSVEAPESDLNVYECSDWNGEKCYSNWREVESDIDTVRDIAKITVDRLAAFVVGTREEIEADLGIDKEIYNLYESLEIEGLVYDFDNKPIDDATVIVHIKDTSKTKTVSTNSDGIFNVQFTVPDKDGTYTIEATITKEPFTSIKVEKDFVVEKSRGMDITIPSGTKMGMLEKKTIELTIKNTGQLALTDLSIVIDKIPSGIVVQLSKESIERLNPQEEVIISVELESIENSTKTSTMDVQVGSSEGVSATKTFALTTERRNSGSGSSTQTINESGSGYWNLSMGWVPDFSLLGGVIASAGGGAGYLLAILIGSLSVALIMRKKRLAGTIERSWIKHNLAGLNKEIRRSDLVELRAKPERNKYADKKPAADNSTFIRKASSNPPSNKNNKFKENNPLRALANAMNEGAALSKKNKKKQSKKKISKRVKAKKKNRKK